MSAGKNTSPPVTPVSGFFSLATLGALFTVVIWGGSPLMTKLSTDTIGGFDLAMMRLFGGYGEACFAEYDAAHPLAEGWRERISLHQLAPLVVHAIKFGGGYVPAVERALGDLL